MSARTPAKLAEQLTGPHVLAAPTGAHPPHVQLVASGVYPPDFGGGQLRVHRTLLRMRDRYPMRVEVLAFSGESTRPGWSTIDDLRICRLAPSTGPLGMMLTVGRHLRRTRREGAGLVYVIATGRLAYVTAFWARMFGLPLMVEIMNCYLHETRARRFAARFFTRAAELVVAISEPVAREIRLFDVPNDRIWVRPNPVDIGRHRFPSGTEHNAERERLGYSDFHILHIVAGCIEKRKNQAFAVNVIERLPEQHRLLMVGPPLEDTYADRLRERIAASPARDRIQLVDRFTDELHRVMYAADCLWMPSLEEGLGNVMLEALCCGVPCIINRALGMDEHVRDGVNGCQAPLDPEAWAQAATSLLPMIRNPERRRAISAAACHRYDAARFDAAFYERLLAVARPKAKQ